MANPAFPPTIYAALGDGCFDVANHLADLAEATSRPVAVYKLIETGKVRDVPICKYTPDP